MANKKWGLYDGLQGQHDLISASPSAYRLPVVLLSGRTAFSQCLQDATLHKGCCAVCLESFSHSQPAPCFLTQYVLQLPTFSLPMEALSRPQMSSSPWQPWGAAIKLQGRQSLQVWAYLGNQLSIKLSQRLPRQPPATDWAQWRSQDKAISAHCGIPLMERSHLGPRALQRVGQDLVTCVRWPEALLCVPALPS